MDRLLVNFWKILVRVWQDCIISQAIISALPIIISWGDCHKAIHNHFHGVNFYTGERILKLAVKAFEKGLLESRHLSLAERLCKRLTRNFPWKSLQRCFMVICGTEISFVGQNGRVAVFDPAVYYGSREMDLAMSRLFGGFDQKFYESYHFISRLPKVGKSRVELCQLYPLLVHLLALWWSLSRQSGGSIM